MAFLHSSYLAICLLDFLFSPIWPPSRAVTLGPADFEMRFVMTTILNGTEFVAAPTARRRVSTVAPVRTGLAARRDTRRNRRATRAI